MRRPPKYVQGFIDRHGKARFYFRRAGFEAVRLPGLPWSPEFMAAYEAALTGQPSPDRSRAGEARDDARAGHKLFRVDRFSFDEIEHAIRLSQYH
jgi:hypothetical protein